MLRAKPLGLALLTSLLVGFGCNGDPLKRQAVSGTVTYKGQPIKRGTISFLPIDGDSSTTSGGIEIVDGAYSIPRAKGLSPGRYKVLVTAPDRIVAADGPPGSGAGIPPKESIPPIYNEKTKLEAKIEQKSGANVVDFTLD